ncbi:MAG: DUF4153 domain-containing protein [Bacteroidota bacterium]
MKLPSIKKLTESAASVIKRFPFEMLFALTGTIAGICYIELQYIRPAAESWSVRVLMMANLGLLLSLAATLYAGSKNLSGRNTLLLKLAAAVFAVALIVLINPYTREADRTRFFLLSLAFHLLVAFAAFTNRGHVQGFWQFNKALFLRFLTSVLYSVVLFGGISAAIGAMNFLFNFNFEWDCFAILWFCIVGLFNTLFFLAGVPDDLQALDADDSYPKGLKIFTQYVLIPLATLYVVILLAYETKILLQWNLPKGLVSNLILGYAVFGILSILLVYPIREREENKWIKTYARSFYFLMLPLLVLLFLAIGTRVFRYGITEDRYFLVVLAIWLLFITAYFLIAKKQNIKLIPISLCIITLLAVYGPQSAFTVSMYSQQHILVNCFKRMNAFKDDKLQPVDSMKVNHKEANKAVATLNYLITHHDMASITPYMPVGFSIDSKATNIKNPRFGKVMMYTRYDYRWDKLQRFKAYLHLSRFSGYEYGDIDEPVMISSYQFTPADDELLNVKGYDYVMMGNQFENDTLETRVGDMHISQRGKNNDSRTLSLNKEVMVFDIKAKVNELLKDEKTLAIHKDTANNTGFDKRYTMPQAVLNITQKSTHFEVMLNISSITFEVDKATKVDHINFVNGQYLIKVKK